jgi:hypothetical protein
MYMPALRVHDKHLSRAFHANRAYAEIGRDYGIETVLGKDRSDLGSASQVVGDHENLKRATH